MLERIIKFIYDPKRVRVIYDLSISSVTVMILLTSFILFSIHIVNTYLIIVYPAIFILINYSYGIYGKYKLSSSYTKTLILAFSGVTAFSIMYLLHSDLLITLLTTVFSIIICSIARILTNLPHQYLRDNYLNVIVSEKLPILVVGGAGYIGSHLVRQLLEKNEKVRLFDKFVYEEDSIKSIKKNKNLEIINGDVSDLYSLTLALKGVKSVVHLAGIVGDPAASIDEGLTRHINIITTRMLKETVKAFKIPKFIFASSCSVYGTTENVVDEKGRLNPVSLYAQTKIDSEKDLLGDPADFFNPTVLRFATVFGHSERMRFDLVLNLFCAQAYYKGKISVFGGGQWRPFVHVSDIARAIIKVLDAPSDVVSRQIFNVGDNMMNTTILNLANMVKEVIKKDKRGKPVKIIINKSIPDKRNYNVSFNKISSKLVFKTETSFNEGIKEIYKNMKNGSYVHNFTNKYYSNYETTKIMKREFHTRRFQDTHYSTLSAPK